MALTVGTNCGVVSTRPTADPAGTNEVCDASSFAIKITAPANTRLIEIGWYCDTATQEANWQGGLYAHSSTKPGSRLAVTSDIAKGTGAGWKYTSLSYDWTGGTAYWLGIQLDNTTTATNFNYATVTGQVMSLDGTSGTTSLLNPWYSYSDEYDGYVIGIYGLYESVGGSVSIPVIMHHRRMQGVS